MNKLKEFRIGVFEEMGAFLTIKASTQKKAEEIAKEQLEMYGIDYDNLIKGVTYIDVTHRDTFLI